MRLFVATDLNNDIIKSIENIKKGFMSFDSELKFVDSRNIHITLKFLGDVREDSVTNIKAVLSDISSRSKSFRIKVQGLGYFGNPSSVRVLWVGISQGRDALSGLMEEICRGLDFIRKDDHPAFPHITIARMKIPGKNSGLIEAIKKNADVNMGEQYVKDIHLISSVLTPEGPVYKKLYSFNLREGMKND